MKKVINKKMYNTETAQLVSNFENMHKSNYSYQNIDFYKKKSGEVFMTIENYSSFTFYNKSKFEDAGFQESFESFIAQKITGSEYEELFGKVEE